jgi:hypothetical protein
VSLNARRITYVVVFLGLMYVTTTTLFLELCRNLFGDGIGTAQADFWNLQCESYYAALMVAFVLDWTWRLRRGDDGWTVETPTVVRRVATYAIFLGFTLVCSAERPVRKVLEPVLPDDIAFSIAHYLRRGLETPVTVLFLLVFFDFVLPFRRRDRIATGVSSSLA